MFSVPEFGKVFERETLLLARKQYWGLLCRPSHVMCSVFIINGWMLCVLFCFVLFLMECKSYSFLLLQLLQTASCVCVCICVWLWDVLLWSHLSVAGNPGLWVQHGDRLLSKRRWLCFLLTGHFASLLAPDTLWQLTHTNTQLIRHNYYYFSLQTLKNMHTHGRNFTEFFLLVLHTWMLFPCRVFFLSDMHTSTHAHTSCSLA